MISNSWILKLGFPDWGFPDFQAEPPPMCGRPRGKLLGAFTNGMTGFRLCLAKVE